MQFRVLGPLEADAGDGPIPLGGPKQRTVLAHLLIGAGRVVPTEQLIDALWGTDPPEAARNTLQSYVSNLRKALGDGVLRRRPPGYLLAVTPDQVDTARFDALLRDARRSAAIDPRSALAVLDDALALWRGPALADVADHPSLVAEATRLDELRLAAMEERIDALLLVGEHARAIGELERLVAQHPLREHLWGNLMLALYRDGRQSEALDAFRRARETLADELGIDPSPELVRRHEQILRQDPALELRGEPLRGYRLLERIGDGGVGTVFRAIQPHVGRDVAIKVIHERVAADPTFARRFEPEAQATAGLEHPHIVPIHDYWREPQAAYVVSRYMRGGSLRTVLDRGDEPDAAWATEVVRQIAAALAYVHGRGMAHGNVSTSNILLDEQGNAYLGDFPIAFGPPAEPSGDLQAIEDVAGLLLGARDIDGAVAPRVAEDGSSADTRSTDMGATDATAIRNPYKGLRAFIEADAEDFFGRRGLTGHLIDRMCESGPGARFLAVVGPSGSGKSSAVRAGLLPAIRAGSVPGLEHCFVVEMFPGAHPMEELGSALTGVAVGSTTRLLERLESGPRGLIEASAALVPEPSELVVVVDQFEELYTLTQDVAERELFVEALRVAVADPASRVRVIVTLRADHYDRPLAHPRFAELLGARSVAVPPLTPDELEEAIRGPAERVGADVEPGLVVEMVSDVAHQPGPLPLLQYALTELFEQREGDRLALGAYRELGGVAGALSARAERLYEARDTAGRRTVEQVFLRLVRLGEGRQDTRRRVMRSELDGLQIEPSGIDEVLDAFGRHRFLTFDREPATRQPTVEIAHEALLTAWGRLRGWIDDARDDLRQERRLVRAADEWRGSGRDPSFLITGARLTQLETWAASSRVSIGTSELEYLAASVHQRELHRADEEARAERERRNEARARRRLQGLVAVLAVGVLIASSLTLIAVGQRRDAAQQSRVAVARQLAAASVANLDVDPERSMLLALEAVETTRSSDGTVLLEAEEALHRAVTASRIVLTAEGVGGSLDWSPDGSMFVTEGPDESGIIDIRDAETGASLRTFPGHEPDVNSVAFSHDGSMLATTGDDGALRIWDPATGEQLWSFEGRPGKLFAPVFSPDDALVAAARQGDQGTVVIRDLASGRITRRIGPYRLGMVGMSFSPDGRRLAVPTQDGTVVVDVRSGDETLEMPSGLTALDADFSPDGRWIASSLEDGTVLFFDAATGALRYPLIAHSALIWSATWSPDSTRLATASSDGTTKVWEVTEGGARELITLVAGDDSGFLGVDFSADGERLMTGDVAVTNVRIWDVGIDGDAEWTNVPASEYSGVAFAADGSSVITSNGSGMGSERDPMSGDRLRTIRLSRGFPAHDIEVSSDGTLAGAGTVVTLWDADREEEQLVPPSGGVGWFADVALSDDGSVRALAEEGPVTTILDRSGSELAAVREDPGFGLLAADLSPDGRLLATSSDSSSRPNPATATVKIRDWARGKTVATIHVWALDVAFDPTGTRIATGSQYGLAEIWDVRSGERLAVLSGHAGWVSGVAFSPDGAVVATSGSDGTVRLWDPATGTQLLTLDAHHGTTWQIAFSPDGSMLASSGEDGVVRVWALDIDDLIRIAQRELTRGFSDAECSQYLHLASCPEA